MQKKAEICPAKKLLRILGQPHVLTIIHSLNDGPRGFTALQSATDINSRTLTLRLEMLMAENILTSVVCPKDARCRYYELTARGKAIEAILKQLDSTVGTS